LFNKRDKGEILKIARVREENEDKLVRKFNNKGYYRYAMESLVVVNNEEYMVPRDWMKLWKL
jgi:hypothetical protein